MDIIVLLDGMTSHIALLLLLVVVLKFVTKRLRLKRADMCLMKIHRPAAYALIMMGAVHMFTSLYCFSERGILPYIAGLISLLAMIGAVCTFRMRMRKTNIKWLSYHRALTVIAVIACAAHPML